MSNQTESMTAEEAAEVCVNLIRLSTVLTAINADKIRDGLSVAEARLRATCGNCQHFRVTTRYGEQRGECFGGQVGFWSGHLEATKVPADGSGFCHEHTPKARRA